MDQQDPQQRIAELERELAQQKRIAELERQLADAKGAAGGGQAVEQPAEVSAAAPRRKSGGIALAIIAVLGGVFGACVGVAAAVTAVIPSTALWMSPIVCRTGCDMAYNTSHYSYKPGQSGTSVSFQCVSNGDYYDVDDFAVSRSSPCSPRSCCAWPWPLVACYGVARTSPADRLFAMPLRFKEHELAPTE